MLTSAHPVNTVLGYAATVVKNIVFTGNQVLGGGTGAQFGCSVNDACDNITVTSNFVANSKDPWGCRFIKTFTTANNTGEADLEAG